MSNAAFISGVAGTVPTADEIAFFRAERPWGFILFKRNIETPTQVLDLTSALREAVGRPEAPVLVDQEGGRVQRLGPPHWPAYPAARLFGEIHARDPDSGRRAAHLGARLMADDLSAVGIDVDCVPCLDVPVEGAHDVIGRRAYGLDPETVVALGRAAAEGLAAGGVLPVMKHMPGHGRAGVDSHLALPRVATPRADLEATDFVPFRALRDLPIAMTAHVVYEAIDPDRPATVSPVVVTDILRGLIGFDGLLLSDDVSMQALGGRIGERAAAALDAGVDVVLHCNGDMAEMREVARAARPLAGDAARRAAAALSRRKAPEPADRDALAAEFAALVGAGV